MSTNRIGALIHQCYIGNDHDQDSDREPEPPVKVVDKTPARTDKRNAPREAPAAPAGGARRAGPGGNEGGQWFERLSLAHSHCAKNQ